MFWTQRNEIQTLFFCLFRLLLHLSVNNLNQWLRQMKKEINSPIIVNSISEQHRLLSLPKPEHPLVSLIYFSDVARNSSEFVGTFAFNFYTVAIKKGLLRKF